MEMSLKGSRDGFTDIYRREMGFSRPRSVARRFSASEVPKYFIFIGFSFLNFSVIIIVLGFTLRYIYRPWLDVEVIN